MKYVFLALLFFGCVPIGPHTLIREQVDSTIDRVWNDEVICYLIGSMDHETAICKWRDEAKNIRFVRNEE